MVTDQNGAPRWDAEVVLPARRSNMKLTISHRLESALAGFSFILFKALGVDRASAFMGGFLRRTGPLLWSIQKRGLANLSLVYPENSAKQNKKILADVWENLGRTVAEYAHLDKFAPFTEKARIDIENEEALRKLIADGTQCIFVSGHIANWELMAVTLFQAGLRSATVYRAANNPIVDEKIIELRANVMSRYLIPKSKRSSRGLIRSLNNGLSVCMLVDQKQGDGIAVPFMGHPAMTGPGTARMALKFGIPIVPLSIKRRGKSARFTFKVHEPIRFEATGNAEEDTARLTAKINDALSSIIHANPGQWLWLHRRWPRELTPN